MILVLNCGSQSIKWKLFGDGLRLKKEGRQNVFDSGDYKKALKKELSQLKGYGKDITKIGHRVVYGGLKLRKPVRITKKILGELERFNKLAPLHNPFNVLGIKIAQELFPRVSQVAVFDTEFYSRLPQKAQLYPLPEEIRKKYGFQRFGFHGISHEYAAKEAAKIIKKPFEELKIITCHLGAGSSITAVKNGTAVDTSMGFTPMEGVMMMTRSGDIDPGIVLGLCRLFSQKRVNEILNFESGVLGISGEKDMLKVLKKVKSGNQKAKLALGMFVCRIQKYIGAYIAVLGGCDLLVFTGAIGSGSTKIRKMICKDLAILKNTKALAIKTNEELAIAEKI